jgi:cell division protease FtsH
MSPAVIARGCAGLLGADLAVNEASLFAARSGKRVVEMKSSSWPKGKVMMGAEAQDHGHVGQGEASNTAFHEAGHAVSGAWYLSMIRSIKCRHSRAVAPCMT